MFKLRVALLAAVGALAAFAGTATGAQAHHRHCCGPLPTVHSNSVVNHVSHVTRYHDTWRKHYFQQTQLFVHTTRIQPIVYVNDVLRVHHVAVGVWHPVHVSNVEYLPTETVVRNSVVNIDDGCICCHPHY